MDILAKAQKVLNNYDPQKFHDNLEGELQKYGIKKGVFCRQIGRASNWFTRAGETKPKLETLIAIQEKFNFDILKLAGIEEDHKKIKYTEEIIINGKKINLQFIHHQVKTILLDDLTRDLLLKTIETLYNRIQKDKIANVM